MSEVVVVTGINGFTGQHMGRYLLNQNKTVVGIGRRSGPTLTDERLIYERCDLSDPQQLLQVIARYPVRYLIHLAGESNVPNAWQEPLKTLQANVVNTLYLLETVRLCQPPLKRVLIVGSAQEYAPVTQPNVVLNEQSTTRPTNPYGSSKMLQTLLSQLYAQNESMPIAVTRTFNLIGPGATGGVCAQMAKQIVEMERGLRAPTVHVGRLSMQRDFLDVRDAVTAYWSLLQQDRIPPGEIFNVCKGFSRTIGSLIDQFRVQANVSFDVKCDPALFRADDVPVIRGANRKLQSATGWLPSYSLEMSIADILQDWRQKEGNE